MDLGAGRYVYRLRRLVAQKDLGRGHQCAGKYRLLLVAAGQLRHPLLRPRQLDMQCADLLCRRLGGPTPPQDAHMGEAVEAGQEDIVPDAEIPDHGLAPPVLGNKDHAPPDGVFRRQRRQGASFQLHRTAGGGTAAEDTLQQLRAAAAAQTEYA